MLNKKGFINLGFILLILSSALAMISFTSVKSSMTSAKDKAFISVASTYLNASATWYASEMISTGVAPSCVTFDTLENLKYIEDYDYDGYIEFGMNNEPVIYITDGDKMIHGKSSDELSESVEVATEVKFSIPINCK